VHLKIDAARQCLGRSASPSAHQFSPRRDQGTALRNGCVVPWPIAPRLNDDGRDRRTPVAQGPAARSFRTQLAAGQLRGRAPVQEFFPHLKERSIGADGSGIEPYQPITDALHDPQ
jgi:hypothetical protein